MVCDVIDRVYSETCQYDSPLAAIDDDRTFEWYLANELNRLRPAHMSAVDALGEGNLYDGGIYGSTCTLSLVNEFIDGNVVTRAMLRKQRPNGSVVEEDIGVVYDKTTSRVSGKVLTGTMSNGLYGSTGSTHTVILKNVGGPKNGINAVWMTTAAWASMCQTS